MRTWKMASDNAGSCLMTLMHQFVAAGQEAKRWEEVRAGKGAEVESLGAEVGERERSPPRTGTELRDVQAWDVEL